MPVRPVRVVRARGEDERDTKEVKKSAIKKNNAKVSVEQAEKGEKALRREDKREYHEAVSEERRADEDGERRESRNTGGSSASNNETAANATASTPASSSGNNDPDKEEEEEKQEEGRRPNAMTVPEGPSAQEREEHELTHIPYRAWCKHCVKA